MENVFPLITVIALVVGLGLIVIFPFVLGLPQMNHLCVLDMVLVFLQMIAFVPGSMLEKCVTIRMKHVPLVRQ